MGQRSARARPATLEIDVRREALVRQPTGPLLCVLLRSLRDNAASDPPEESVKGPPLDCRAEHAQRAENKQAPALAPSQRKSVARRRGPWDDVFRSRAVITGDVAKSQIIEL